MSAFVYGFQNADRAWLYIGCTEDVRNRAYGHRVKPWWPEAVSLRVLAGPAPLRSALAIERHLIEKHDPLHNRIWTSAWRAPRLAAGERVEPRPLSELDALILRRGYAVPAWEREEFQQFWRRLRTKPVRHRTPVGAA